MSTRQPTAQDVADVLRELKFFGGGMDRSALAYMTQLPDRLVRACIRAIDLAPDHLAVSHKGGGYRLVTDPEEIRQMADEHWSRAAKSRERAVALERAADRRELLQTEFAFTLTGDDDELHSPAP